MPESTPASIVSCPSCRARLKVPASSAPVTRLRCPRCQAVCPTATPAITLDLKSASALDSAAVTRSLAEPAQATVSLDPPSVPLDSAAETRSLAEAATPSSRAEFTSSEAVAAHRQDKAPLAKPVGDSSTKIGRFVLGELLGEGAFGEVYKARDPQLNRDVAVKLAKADALNHARIERFLGEAKAAAKLRHPNIVPVFDAGKDQGRYYIASAFIQGQTLEAAIAEGPLDRHTSVELVRKVAEALDYAHRQGIVHRDIKPANTMIDETGEPMLMDFGLARRLDEEQKKTQDGKILGTPQYMSPEQAGGKAGSVGPASDQYSLGVMLYEMLTGRPPFEGTVELVIFHHMETEPLPLRKLNRKVPADLETICLKCLDKTPDRRFASCGALAEDLRRWREGEPITARRVGIVERGTKWCRKNRLTATALGIVALTLLIGSLVAWGLAGWALRERTVAIEKEQEASTQTGIAQANEKKAIESEAEAKKQQQLAEQEKSIALTVRDVMKNKLLRQANPYQYTQWAYQKTGRLDNVPTVQRDLTVREVLDRASQELAPEVIDKAFPGQPLVQAEILDTMSESYEGLREFRTSLQFAQAAQAIREKHLGPMHPVALSGHTNLIFCYLAAGKVVDTCKTMVTLSNRLETLVNQLPENTAEASVHPNVAGLDEIVRRIGERANPHSFNYPRKFDINFLDGAWMAVQVPQMIERVARVKDGLARRFGASDRRTLNMAIWEAFARYASGDKVKATEMFEAVYKRATEGQSVDDRVADGIREVLIGCYADLKIKQDESVRILEQAYQSRLALVGPFHPNTVFLRHTLASTYNSMGKVDLAIKLYKENIEVEKSTLGFDHQGTLTSINNLAVVYQNIGKDYLAIPLLEQTVKIRRTKLGIDDDSTLASMVNLACSYRDTGKLTSAIRLYEEAIPIEKLRLGAEHPETLVDMRNLADCYRRVGQHSLSIPLLEDVLKAHKSKFGTDHLTTLSTMHDLGMSYADSGKPALAVPLLEKTVEHRKMKLGRDDPNTLASMNNLGLYYNQVGKSELGVPLLEETVKIRKVKLGVDHRNTQISINNLIRGYSDAGEWERAAALRLEILNHKKTKLGADHAETLACMGDLIAAYKAAGNLERAVPISEELISRLESKFGPSHRDTVFRTHELATVYFDLERYPNAEKLLRQLLALRDKMQSNAGTAFQTRSLLGGALLAQKKYEEAEPLLLEGFREMNARAASPSDRAQLADAADRLVRLYKALGREDEVKQWSATLVALEGALDPTIRDAALPIEIKGELSSSDPSILYQVRFKSGRTYIIDMVSPDSKALDPYLVLQTAQRKILAQDDDSGGDRNARITIRIPSDGVYRIRATSFNRGRGPFAMTIRTKD